MENNPRIVISDLRKSFSRVEIIRGVNFEVFPGEVLGLIGPNGAGKSTIIKMLTGLIYPNSGEINYEGMFYKQDFVKIKPNIGAIVENPDLFPYLTGMDHLKLKSKMYPGTTNEDILRSAEIVEMTNALDKKVKAYSLGMKQRLSLATILLGNPDFIILDEPFNGLDPSGIRDLRTIIRNLALERNISVLVSSHILSEVEALCDRIVMISKGQIIDVKTMEELTSNTDDRRVRIKTDNQVRLSQYLNFRNVPFEEAYGYIIASYDYGSTTDLIKELLNENFEIFAIEQMHRSLEDAFVEVMDKWGGIIE